MFHTKRVYEPAEEGDGFRVLVDRLWPRGMAKERAKTDRWLKDVAPSDELRNWYRHEPEKFAEFARRYRSELTERPEPVDELRALEREHGTVTLLFAAKDAERNNAEVLRDMLQP